MRISGTLVSLLTFPGVIIHELAHRLSCVLAGVSVYKVRYFRLGNPSGYVVHGGVHDYSGAFLICVAPFLLNTGAALAIFAVAINKDFAGAATVPLLSWLGISIAMHSFPSGADADNLWDYSKEMWTRNLWALLGFPVSSLIKLANRLRAIWFDLLYALGLLFLIDALSVGRGLI